MKKLSEYTRSVQLEMLLADPHCVDGHSLGDYTQEEQARLDYAVLCSLRRKAYTEHVEKRMVVDPAVAGWAAAMAAKHGPKVRVWANAVSWVESLLIVRYGEAVEHWPEVFTEQDLDRAKRWAAGTIPSGVTLIEGKE